MEYKEIQAKQILTKSGIPSIDYVLNPYIGCRFACKYCYASFMGRFVDKKIEEWGEYVFIKINAAELLKNELSKLKNGGLGKEIFISSVTDAYQGIEAKYKLTRKCLAILAEQEFAGNLSILTKSDLVSRDIDLLKLIKHVTVGLTVTSTDDSISSYFETYAPPTSKRLETLKELNENGIQTYAFVGPLLPHFATQKTELEKLFKKLREVGTTNIFVEHLNMSTYIKNRLITEMKGTHEDIVQTFYLSQTQEYRKTIEDIVYPLINKYGMTLMRDMVIYHKASS